MRGRNTKVNIIVSLVVTAIIAVVLGVLAAGNFACNCYQCSQKTNGMGLPHRNLFYGGCQIQINGSWIPLENYREFGQ